MDPHDAVTPEIPGVAIDRLVARTRLSEVWRGRLSDDGVVAVKLAVGPDRAAMLRSEADTVDALGAAGVRGIVPVRFADQPIPHLILPWKGSRTFRNVLDEIRGGDDRSRAARLLIQVIETVAEVHRHGFLHGDLKPENILIDEEGRPWLTDFGMAKAIRAARLESHISRSMDRKSAEWGGTLRYLPPEGLQGEEPTPAWDVYALGVMLHEVLLSRPPDRAATPEELQTLLPGEVVQILLRALAYEPSERFPSAGPLLGDVSAIRHALTATGGARWLLRLGRLVLTGLSAFFVALRYASVVAIVLVYVTILVRSTVTPGFLLAFLPFVLLHLVIRWEGPETNEEARNRGRGVVLARRKGLASDVAPDGQVGKLPKSS
jgi:hypothetical protein